MSMQETVFLVDDDASVRDALTRLFESADYAVEAYPDAEAFLAAYALPRPGCLFVDIQLPGMGGLGLQMVLAGRKDCMPIIFLTAYGTVSSTVRALKTGAFEFLEKPVEGSVLLECVRKALVQCAGCYRESAEVEKALSRCASLTVRELEVLPLVASGACSKSIARRLGISHRTVELHRMHIFHKTGVNNVIELADIVKTCGISATPSHEDHTDIPETRLY